MTKSVKDFIFNQKTTIFFLILCALGIIAADQPISFVLNELLTRFGRNTFIVLALLIPIQAGMGLNFAIVIGAIAAQIGVFFVVHWGINGLPGMLLCALISAPLSIIFGGLVGNLFNKMKGSEMIGGIILGFFSDGLYQLLFLFLIGTLIPISNPVLMISGGIGVKNTIDLAGKLKYSIDDILRLTLLDTMTIVIALVAVYTIAMLIIKHRKELKSKDAVRCYIRLGVCVVIYALTFIPYVETLLFMAKIPVVTFGLIALLYVFSQWFMKTVMGQNMRTVGQSMSVARASGINVDRTRMLAMIISTVLAGWGQLLLLQNIGTFQTYGAHTQVGIFAIAALLVGGASVHKASGKQAIIGVILFHTLFIVSPIAGKNLLDNAQLGEYFRVFVSYGVIAVSLALHAWKSVKKTSGAKAADAEQPEPTEA